jgi:chromosome segregation ATPase
MPVLLRALFSFLAPALLVFAGFTGWYSWHFQDTAAQPQARIKPLLPQISRAIANDTPEALTPLLKTLPFQVVISDSDGQIVASNLQGREGPLKAAKEALKAHDFNAEIRTPDGLAQIYFSQSQGLWNPILFFPLIFSLLLGLLSSFWDYFNNRQTEDAVGEIRILTRENTLNSSHEEKWEEQKKERERLLAKITSLQKQLEITDHRLEQTRLNLHQTQLKLSEQDAGEAREKAQTLEQELKQSLHKLKRLQETLLLQNEMEIHLRDKQEKSEKEQQALKQLLRERDNELAKLEKAHQQQGEALIQSRQSESEKSRQLGQINQRLHELEDINRQVYEAYQEIEKLRKSELELMRREEIWQKDKQKLLGLLSEREQLLQETRERLSLNRQKLRELSIAYKQQLEIGQNNPTDLSEAHDLIRHLISDKDDVERENAHLQVELSDKSSEINRLRKELETRALHVQESDHRLEEMEKEFKKLRLELELVGDTLSDKLLDLDRLSSAHSEDSLALESLMQERDILKQSLLDTENQMQQLREEKAHLLFEKESLAEKLEKIDIQDYELQIEQLKQSLQVVGAQQQRKQEALNNLKDKLQQGAELYEKLKRLVEKKERLIDQLNDDVTRKESIIHLLEQKLEKAGIIDPAGNY